MFLDIFRFELNFHRRQYLFYVLSGVFFLLAFLATTTPNVQLVGGVGNLNINAPYTVISTLGSISLMSLFGAIAFCASGVIRDYDLGTAELFLSTPVDKRSYIYGRFAGSMVFAVGLYLAGLLGVLLGEFMPWLDQERIGAFSFEAYWFASWAIAVPNLLVCCCLLFCVATVTRSMMATYVGMVILLMLTFLIGSFTEKETVELTSILDPFGATAFEEMTRYWTVFEKNAQVPGLTGALLANRLLWLGIGAAFLAAAYPLYPFSLDAGRRRRKPKLEEERTVPSLFGLPAAREVTQRFDGGVIFSQYLSQAKLEVRNIVKSVPFAILLLVGLFMVTGNAIGNLGNIFGTAVHPTTSIMVNIINGAFSLSLLAVLIYYSGELMVRERSVRVNEIMDAMPFPNVVMIAAKLTGLAIVIVAMLLAAMIAGIGVQLYKGFYDINIGQYLLGLLFFFQFPLYLMMVLSVFFYILTRSKYAAMALMIIYFIATLAAPQMGFEHYLYRMRQLQIPYSDFTGFSHNLVPYLWQTAYWGLFGCLMLLVIHLMWPRGTEDDIHNRLKVLRQRMTQPVVISIWAFSTLFLLCGGYIYYNTNVLNQYVTNKERQVAQAEYEKQYKQFEYQPMPAIRNVYADVDIYPDERDVYLRGYYDTVNETGEPLSEVHFSMLPWLKVRKLDVPGATLTMEDADLGFRIYTLDRPLAPGEALRIDYDIAWQQDGFANNGFSPKITPNGTFFNNLDIFPILGYRDDAELQDNNDRRDHDLPPLDRMTDIDDESGHMRVGFGASNRVNFETVVSTKPGQLAIAPGYLQSEWEEHGRHYYHYKMDAPIWNFFAYLSGDYEVVRDEWNDIAIEVYYLHDYNVETMVRSTKNSLAYFSENFSPYQYRQFRIMEFPRYQGVFAQSFPNTIPFSEAIGFTADLTDPENIDYVYYVTAHELAHQWWAHQVLGADVQGSTMIVESLAQYSALMVMKEEYGEAAMKRFLEFELDRYLSGRGGELIDEMPLNLVENQPYIHYRKGSVVLYALQDYIGEDNMNRALANFIDKFAFGDAPFPTTRDLIASIRAEAPEAFQPVITDLLEKIVLYDLSVAESSVTPLPDGKFEVTFDVVAKKFEANGAGEESEVPMSGWVDIGVLGEEDAETRIPSVIHLEKVQLNASGQTFTLIVDEEPKSVGIDPLNKLIDRDPGDNISPISS